MFVITRKRDKSFAVGYLLVGVLLCVFALAAQPGMYWGLVHVKALILTDELDALIIIRAETEPAWRWVGPDTPRYKYGSAEMKVLTDGDRPVHLDLVKGMWESAGNRGPLDAENLARIVMKGPQAETGDSELGAKMTGLLGFLHDMRDGNVPPLGHHGYGGRPPLDAAISCFSCDTNYGIFALLFWLALWPVYLCLPRPKPVARWLTPRKAFVIAAGGAIVLDLVFAGIDLLLSPLLSPGWASKAMGSMIELVNLPVVIFTGWGSWVDLFPIGLAVSAIAWGVILSICVIFAKERQTQDR